MSASNIPQDANPASHGHHHYFFIPINFAFIQTSPSAAASPAPQPNITPATQPNAQPSQQPSNNAQPTPVTPVNIFFTFPLTPGQTGIPSQSGIPIWFSFFNGVPFPTQQQTYQGQPPASPKAINALPLVTITPQHVADQVSCAICQDAFTLPGDANATPVRQMPCGHLFCESCLFPWLQQSNTCPTCRFEILTDNDDYNASVRRRMKEREEACAKKHAEDEKHNHVHDDLSCSLAAVGICRVESTGSRAVKLPCGHSFHVPCLRTALLIEGHNLDTEAREGSISMYCPSCRQASTIEAATIALKNEEEQNMKPQEGNVIRNQYKTTVEEVVNDMDFELD